MPRLTIACPEQVDKLLKELAEKGDTSKVDVLRRALALYNYVNKGVKRPEARRGQ
jgi:predicted transcriptional regulator